MLPYPCPSDDGSGTSAPWLPVHRALTPPFLLRCLLGALPSSRCGGCLGTPPSSSVLFTWAPMPPSIACERRSTGGLLPSVVWRTAPGAQFRTWRCVAPGWTGDRSPSSTAGFLSLA
ncbi:hypothetical protein GWK47_006617 [Chionoecetes opilio]|uniref:Uncharacterized protein n=1 Tax=Chionoecetes opilio TaxID=41210 RepID=A0A8J5CUV2_CHIOP|nr:hypothetical protein GWK47_006617 [Chionoecetes opilio]